MRFWTPGTIHTARDVSLLAVGRPWRRPAAARNGGELAQAAEALGSQLGRYRHRWQLRYLRIVESLVRGLDDPAPDVRLWSIYALVCLGEKKVLPKLHAMAATDTGTVPGMWTVRQEALWAIQDLEFNRMCDPRSL